MKSPFSKKLTFVHTGHIGDIIAFLPVFNAMGGTDLVIRDGAWMMPMSGYKYDSLKPLLESQGIQVSFNNPASSIDHDVSGWRECYEHTLSLTDAQARYMNVVPRGTGHLEITKPWLKVEADPLTKGRVIINRTPRYRNPNFPWKNVLKHFGDKALFIGTEQEHLDYLCEVGNIEYYKTENCLDVARAIEGSEFFVGNQSSAFWIAAGLRKPLLQEMDLVVTNSVVPFDGAMYPYDCNVDFDKLPK
jgi:ADP-heptose:LPS heptosyltransferase